MTSVYPVLREDGSSLDWRLAHYEARVEVKSGVAQVRHVLHDAPEIAELIDKGRAAYALEVRCPRTLFAKTTLAGEPKFSAEWRPEDVEGVVYLTPGILATERVELPETALIDLWGGADLHLPAGWWLAKGKVYASESLASSLIEFLRDKELPRGRMRVAESLSGEEPRFVVSVAPDLYERVPLNRDVQIAALIAAFSCLPKSAIFQDEESESRVVRALRQRLDAEEVPTWDTDDWDPAWAATAIERFHPPTPVEHPEDA